MYFSMTHLSFIVFQLEDADSAATAAQMSTGLVLYASP